MSSAGSRYRLMNVAGRPLELHLSAEVLVLPPGADAVRDQADVELPQIQALRGSGALVIRAAEAPPPQGPADAAPKRSRRARRKSPPKRKADK
jgi:hypothetical protein